MFLLAITALADIPPPPGISRVPYEITVKGVTSDRDPALVVFPWSDSNGSPTAEIAVVGEKNLAFGRRIQGRPKFWLVPQAKLQEARGLEEDALDAWFTANAEACEGEITPRHEVLVVGPSAVIDQFSLQADPCKVTLEVKGGTGIGAVAGGGSKPGEAGGVRSRCGCQSSAPAMSLFFLALPGLWRRRAQSS